MSVKSFHMQHLTMSTHINSNLNLTIVCYHLDEYSRFWKEGGLNLDLEANIRSNAIFSYSLQQRFVKIKLNFKIHQIFLRGHFKSHFYKECIFCKLHIMSIFSFVMVYSYI